MCGLLIVVASLVVEHGLEVRGLSKILSIQYIYEGIFDDADASDGGVHWFACVEVGGLDTIMLVASMKTFFPSGILSPSVLASLAQNKANSNVVSCI